MTTNPLASRPQYPFLSSLLLPAACSLTPERRESSLARQSPLQLHRQSQGWPRASRHLVSAQCSCWATRWPRYRSHLATAQTSACLRRRPADGLVAIVVGCGLIIQVVCPSRSLYKSFNCSIHLIILCVCFLCFLCFL